MPGPRRFDFTPLDHLALGGCQRSRVDQHLGNVPGVVGVVIVTPAQVARVAAARHHRTVIIPGYVAMLSGELEEQSGWTVVVGPKEAAQLPAFLKKLKNGS